MSVMTYIQQPSMDPYEFLDDGYSRLDHMDGLGMRPGMIRGPRTGLPIPAPEPVETVWGATREGWAVVAGLIGFVTVLGSIAILLAAVTEGVLR